jgi:hypothetical protein
VRLSLSIDPNTGAKWNEASRLGEYFGHKGFRNPETPDNIEEDLDAMTRIRVFAAWEKTSATSFMPRVSCEAPLLGTAVFFKD